MRGVTLTVGTPICALALFAIVIAGCGSTPTGGAGGDGGGEAGISNPADAARAVDLSVSPSPDAAPDLARSDAASPPAPNGTIVPLYTDPTDPSWAAVVAAHRAHPTVPIRAIINPNSGPGAARDASYAVGIATLDNAGITVLGYVATTYGARPKAAVQMEIDSYKAWYPALRGIFFDEMSSTAGQESYYLALANYARNAGCPVTVGNPGTETLPSYVATVDTLLIYEDSGVPALNTLGGWHRQYPSSHFGVIPYNVPALDAAFIASARPLVGFIYLTNDNVPNPWDSLSGYFAALLGALE